MSKTIAKVLSKLGACDEAVKWAKPYGIDKTRAWRECQNGSWMMWLMGQFAPEPDSEERRKLVLCACECARLALVHVQKGEDRPLKAIEMAEQWARGDASVTLDQIRNAANDAYDAFATTTKTTKTTKIASAAYSAFAVATVATVAYAYVATYAYAAASAAYPTCDAYKKTLAECADIVRRHYSRPPTTTQIAKRVAMLRKRGAS